MKSAASNSGWATQGLDELSSAASAVHELSQYKAFTHAYEIMLAHNRMTSSVSRDQDILHSPLPCADITLGYIQLEQGDRNHWNRKRELRRHTEEVFFKLKPMTLCFMRRRGGDEGGRPKVTQAKDSQPAPSQKAPKRRNKGQDLDTLLGSFTPLASKAVPVRTRPDPRH